MSRWRDVWRQSVYAYSTLCADRTEGEKQFERLLAKYSSDPMIVYERAEAYEHIGQLEWARTDYADAAERFVEPHWSDIARLGLEQVKGRPQAGAISASSRQLRERIHALHSFPRLPTNVLADALSCVARIDSEPHLAAMNLRAALEQLAWKALGLSGVAVDDGAELCELIHQLEENKLVSAATRAQMHVVRIIGNRAAHGCEIPEDKSRDQLRSFLAVADWYCRGAWATNRPRTAYRPR